MDESVLSMLEAMPGDVQDRVMAVDKVLMNRIPDLKRVADPADRLIGYMLGPGYRGTVFTILISGSGVKIGFSHGATLPDPGGLLGGKGKVHRTFVVHRLEDLQQPSFLALIDDAYAAYQQRSGQ